MAPGVCFPRPGWHCPIPVCTPGRAQKPWGCRELSFAPRPHHAWPSLPAPCQQGLGTAGGQWDRSRRGGRSPLASPVSPVLQRGLASHPGVPPSWGCLPLCPALDATCFSEGPTFHAITSSTGLGRTWEPAWLHQSHFQPRHTAGPFPHCNPKIEGEGLYSHRGLAARAGPKCQKI